ncbi:MAG TPA: hypothetical protein VMG40_18785 [Bryobacteraceae bacterium]|nr:hypothetical protein [Bryobacteraceae bacterium]
MMRKRTTLNSKKDGSRQAKISRDKKSGTVTVSLRIPVGMLSEIDEALKRRPYRIPRHMWLLEAIHEKLARLRETPTPHIAR